MRTCIRPAAIGLMLLFTGSTLAGNVLAGNMPADDWPMYRKDAGRTAVCQSRISDDLTLRWTRQLPPLTPRIS